MIGLQDRDSADITSEEISDSASSVWESVLDTVPRIGVALAIIIVGYGISRIVRWSLRRTFARRQTQSFSLVMSKVGGWIVVFLFVMAAIAVTFPSVKPVDLLAGLGFFSVAVGFAFQDILENTLAGILLLFRQPFESGDQIEVQSVTGTVEAITIRETRLKTFDGQLVVIPNRDVYKSAIRVQTHYPARRLDFVVGVAYENDAREATRVIVDALEDLEGIAADPAAEALVIRLGVSTVDIEVRFWSHPRQHDARVVLDRAITRVKKSLEIAGIEMPADIVALQATPSFRAALQGDGDVTPGGSLRSDSV